MLRKRIDDAFAAHELMGEQLSLLKSLLEGQQSKSEKDLKKDGVSKKVFNRKKLIGTSVPTEFDINKFKDLDSIFDQTTSHSIYPLGPGEGGSDLGKRVQIQSPRQVMFFNFFYEEIIMRGERVFSVPLIISRLSPILRGSMPLCNITQITLDNQWPTGLNHLSNSIFALGHPPFPEAIITRHQFVGKTILWYRFTDGFLKEFLSKGRGLFDFRRTLKKFGVEIHHTMLTHGLGLPDPSLHPLLRTE